MHFEVLVEGESDKIFLDTILSKILNNSNNTYSIHKHQGIGSLPGSYIKPPAKTNRTLLGNLPIKLKAYSKTLQNMGSVLIIIDLDNKHKQDFEHELKLLHSKCSPNIDCLFIFAIEELEAWYLGDKKALQKTYPKLNKRLLDKYKQDSICCTAENLYRIIYTQNNSKKDIKIPDNLCYFKCELAKMIPSSMDINGNESPSFIEFRDRLKKYLQEH